MLVSLINLVRDPGTHFTEPELDTARVQLQQMNNSERIAFRNVNAKQIAEHGAPNMVIVAGPGAGKSFLFMDRIRSWLKSYPEASIRVASFVRKLVGDLRVDIDGLRPEEAKRVTASTLHSLSRSLIARNGGTQSLPLGQYVRIISEYWEEMVWGDVLSLGESDGASLREFKDQFHENDFSQVSPWPSIRQDYSRLRRFYSAVGFADSIVLATDAVHENPDLIDCELWILDEFQDFNKAEAGLIQALTSGASGVLLAGDDDQALYQRLKASHPEIIRSYYGSDSQAKGMLPFCSRCGYHITLAAESFLMKNQETESIRKIFLPLQVDEGTERVRVIACANPATAAAYVERFIEDHRDELAARRKGLEDGTEKDPFLLVLSFSRDLSYLGPKPQERIETAVAEWQLTDPSPGSDYFKVMLYARCARVPTDNFTLRKVLHFENVSDETVHDMIRQALEAGRTLVEVMTEELGEVRQRCRLVLRVLEDEGMDAEEKAASLNELVAIGDVDQLALDLQTGPVEEEGAIPKEEEEEVFTAGRLSPVEILSMAGAKGLSADNIIILGSDQLNMKHASVQLFFVALTRARRSLHVITSLKAKGATRMHHFLGQLPADNCVYLTATQKGLADKGSYVKLAGWLAFMLKQFKKTTVKSKGTKSK